MTQTRTGCIYEGGNTVRDEHDREAECTYAILFFRPMEVLLPTDELGEKRFLLANEASVFVYLKSVQRIYQLRGDCFRRFTVLPQEIDLWTRNRLAASEENLEEMVDEL